MNVAQLFEEHGTFRYRGGWNPAAVIALTLGVLPNLPGFLNVAFPASFPDVANAFKVIYTYAWFVGVLVAGLVYWVLMRSRTEPAN